MRVLTFVFACCLLTAPLCAVYEARAAGPLNRTVAVINGEMITSYDLNAAVAPELARAGLDPKKSGNSAAVDAVRKQVLNRLIDDIIIQQEAERLQITATEGEISTELQRFREGSKLDEAAFVKELQRQGYDTEGFRKQIRKNLLKSRLLSIMVGRKVVVTKEEIAQYYAANSGAIPTTVSGGVRLAVIVYPPNADADSWAARIKNGKVSFADAVRQVSIGPMREQGGDLGVMDAADLAPALLEHLAGLKNGEVSPLFDVDGMRAQVRLITRDAPVAKGATTDSQSLEAAAPQIERILREPKLQERYAEYMEQLRKRAVLDVRL